MNSSHSTGDELSLEWGFLLFYKIVGQFDSSVISAVDFVPNEAVNIFTLTFDFIENVFNRL